jgi:hypothetical protein
MLESHVCLFQFTLHRYTQQMSRVNCTTHFILLPSNSPVQHLSLYYCLSLSWFNCCSPTNKLLLNSWDCFEISLHIIQYWIWNLDEWAQEAQYSLSSDNENDCHLLDHPYTQPPGDPVQGSTDHSLMPKHLSLSTVRPTCCQQHQRAESLSSFRIPHSCMLWMLSVWHWSCDGYWTCKTQATKTF